MKLSQIQQYLAERHEDLEKEPLEDYIEEKIPKEPTFDSREPDFKRKNIVYGRIDTGQSNRYYMFVDGVEVGHAGVLKDKRALCDVTIYSVYQGCGLSHPLVEYVVFKENPTCLTVKASGPVDNNGLIKLYSKFGFKISGKSPTGKTLMAREG